MVYRKRKCTRVKSVDDILNSLSKLYTKDNYVGENYTEFIYGNHSYPIIEDDGIKFAVLPKNMTVFKALPGDANLTDYFSGKEYPYPSFYSNYEIASDYLSGENKRIVEFRTTRPIKIFILNDVHNLIELARLFSQTSGVRGILKNSRKEAVRELLMVTGLGTHCTEQNEYRTMVENALDIEYSDYMLNVKICESIQDESLKRLSLYAVDLQFSRNLCHVLSQYGNDGYIASNMPTAFGEIAPVFHEEMMFCFTSDVLEEVKEVKK